MSGVTYPRHSSSLSKHNSHIQWGTSRRFSSVVKIVYGCISDVKMPQALPYQNTPQSSQGVPQPHFLKVWVAYLLWCLSLFGL